MMDEALGRAMQVVSERLVKPSEMDPCGECPKGECDDCHWCVMFRDPDWRNTTKPKAEP